MTIDNHVKFDHIDEQEENERSFRGFEHRKDLVRGIKFQKQNDVKIKEAHIEHGFSWLRASDRTLESIEKLELGVRLVLHGFLVFFYQETYSETADVNEDLLSLFEHFKKTELPLDLLGKNLKEHLALLSILVVDNNFDVVDVEIDDKP